MELKSPFYIELSSPNDFGRLVCALERSPLPSFSLMLNKERILSVQTDFFDGNPLIYYIKDKQFYNKHFLAYKILGSNEEVVAFDSASNPSYVYSPIINIDTLPPQLTKKARSLKKSSYVSIKLRDLESLAKVAAYKTLYDEPSLPLFLFKNTKNKNKTSKFILGTYINLIETESFTYFYYYELENEPSDVFLKYSTQKIEKPTFSNNIDEHGYIYLKTIKLIDNHPLVNVYD